MENSIEIPPYNVLVPNEVFGKGAGRIKLPRTGKISSATQIFHLAKYTVPSNDEIINLIISSARESSPTLFLWENYSKNSLNRLMKDLSLDEITGIREGKESSLNNLREHCPSISQAGRTYVQIINGIVPDRVFGLAASAIKERGGEVYSNLLETWGEKNWNLKIRLDENKSFPKKAELDYW